MKRNSLRLILVGAVLIVLGAGSPVFAQVQGQACRPPGDDCKRANSCVLEVALQDVSGQCKVTSLNREKTGLETFRVRLCVGDKMTWAFDNQCNQDVTAEVANFQPVGSYDSRECRDQDPFTGAKSLKVPRKQKQPMVRQTTAKHYPRTYKYEIVVIDANGKRAVLDPEGEIYR
jgi:hypothetical protein